MEDLKSILKNDIKFTTEIYINGELQKTNKLNVEQIDKLLKFYNTLINESELLEKYYDKLNGK